MKVFKDGKLYVNKKDLLVLRKSQCQIPDSVLYDMENSQVLLSFNESDIYVEFSDEKDIDFFKKVDWIVDYDSVRDLNMEVLKKLMANIKSTMSMLRVRLDSLCEITENSRDDIRFDMLEQMLLSLEKIYDSRVSGIELFGMLQEKQTRKVSLFRKLRIKK